MRTSALWFVAPRQVEVRDVELPEPGPGDAVVRAEWSGISGGTELLAYRGEVEPSTPLDSALDGYEGTFSFPFRYGYSCAGVVERPVAGLRAGERVFCFHPHQRRVVVPAGRLVPLGSVPTRAATLLPTVETAVQVARDASPRLFDVVAVTGLGAVGLLTAALLRRAGAEVIGSDPSESSRAAAAAFGVPAVPPTDLAGAVRDASGGRGADRAVEATGDPAALEGVLDLLAHEGTAVVASWYGTRRANLPLGAGFHRRRLTIRSSQVSTVPSDQPGWSRDRRLQRAARLLRELPIEVLATHAFPFEEANRAFAALDRGEPGLLHAALEYS